MAITERRDEVACACRKIDDDTYLVKYWDGAWCLVSADEAKERPIKVGSQQGGD